MSGFGSISEEINNSVKNQMALTFIRFAILPLWSKVYYSNCDQAIAKRLPMSADNEH